MWSSSPSGLIMVSSSTFPLSVACVGGCGRRVEGRMFGELECCVFKDVHLLLLHGSCFNSIFCCCLCGLKWTDLNFWTVDVHDSLPGRWYVGYELRRLVEDRGGVVCLERKREMWFSIFQKNTSFTSQTPSPA